MKKWICSCDPLRRASGIKTILVTPRPWTCIEMIIIPVIEFTAFLPSSFYCTEFEFFFVRKYWHDRKWSWLHAIDKLWFIYIIITFIVRPFLVSFVLVMRGTDCVLCCLSLGLFKYYWSSDSVWYIWKSDEICGCCSGNWACLCFSWVAKTGLSGSAGLARERFVQTVTALSIF